MRRTLVVIGIAGFAGCPVPGPSERDGGATPAAPSAPVPPVRTEPVDSPVPPNEPSTRPIVGAFRQALATLHTGDPVPIQAIVASTARWSRPVADPEPRDRDALLTALARGVAGPTRILDLGAGAFATQLRTTDDRGTLAIVDVVGSDITGVRTYGADPLAASQKGLPAAATGASVTAIVAGRPNLKHVALTKRIYEAAAARAFSKIEAATANGATHETYVDGEHGGEAEATFARSFAALLAEPGARLTIRKQHAVADYVLVEAVVGKVVGKVAGKGEGPTLTPVVGVVDVLRLHEGRIAASFRYLNHRD